MGNHQHHPRLNYCNHLMAFFLRQLFHVCPWPRPRKTQLNTGRLKKRSGTQSRWDLCIHADGVSCRGACCDWRLHSVFHCVLCSPFVAVMVGLFPLNSCWWRLNSPADPWVISTVRTLFWKTVTRHVKFLVPTARVTLDSWMSDPSKRSVSTCILPHPYCMPAK